MSDSVWSQRQQPTKLPGSWDPPGKNTGAGCHFLLQCVKVKSESEVAQSCPTLSDPKDRSLPGSSIHGIFQARVLEWGAIAFSSFYSITYQMRWVKTFCDWKFAHFSFHYLSLRISVYKVLSIYRVMVVVSFCNFGCFIPMKCFSLPQFLLTQDLFGCY